MDTTAVISLGQRPIAPTRCRQPPARHPNETALLLDLLTIVPEPVPAFSEPLLDLKSATEPVPVLPVPADTDAEYAGSDRQTRMIRTLQAARYSATDIAALMGGNRAAALTKIRAAKMSSAASSVEQG